MRSKHYPSRRASNLYFNVLPQGLLTWPGKSYDDDDYRGPPEQRGPSGSAPEEAIPRPRRVSGTDTFVYVFDVLIYMYLNGSSIFA